MPQAPLRKWVELNLGKKTFLSAKAAAPFLQMSSQDSAAATNSPAGETEEEEAKKRRKKEKKEKKEKKAKKEKAEKEDDDEEEDEAADEFFYLKLPPKEAGVVVEEAKRPSEAEVKVIDRLLFSSHSSFVSLFFFSNFLLILFVQIFGAADEFAVSFGRASLSSPRNRGADGSTRAGGGATPWVGALSGREARLRAWLLRCLSKKRR